MKAYRNRNFLLTYAASFISLFGSKLLMMAYVAYIFAARGSATLASIVLAADWATCLAIGLFGSRYIDRLDARRLLIGLNLVASLVTLLFLGCTDADRFPYAIAVIVARALLSHAVNSARIKALVQFFTPHETERFSAVFNSSLFMATALAGAVGVFVLKFIDLRAIVYFDSATFVIAAAVFAFVVPNPERLRASIEASRTEPAGGIGYITGAFRVIGANADLASAVFYIILSVTAFQANYEVLMAIVPQIWFGLGKSGTALFFTCESVFVTGGAFLYQYLAGRGLIRTGNQHARNLWVVVFSATVFLTIPQLKHNLYACLAAFNVMVIAVELVWTHQFKQMILATPPAKVAAVTGVQMAMGYSLMGVFAFAFSTAVDRWGIPAAVDGDVLAIALLSAAWELWYQKRTRVRAAAVSAAPNQRASVASAAIRATSESSGS